ncbi:hypothetical protein JHL17_35450 [Azospirillum sp. YIM B02556]|uniref:Transposase n=1 Tax=Azospirillum endophyticum TaxID=2800326 RepID=A0ABS1FH98_9PROT|nr:hypothetical protein [Azospirillum endophyticum]MBK1842703.1 hypothetical protein [Azospirillum endophyticum]
MGTAVRPASTTPASWDAFSDVEAFVEEVPSEPTAMAADGSGPTRSGPKPALTGAALRKAILAIWCVCFRGIQWRAIDRLSGITVQPIARGRDGMFIPTEIACVVERSFSWISRCRRLNTIVERTKDHLVAFGQIAVISILSRRLKRLVPQDVSA